MADPARNLDPNLAEANYVAPTVEIKQSTPEVSTTGGLVGPSVAANDNAVANDNGNSSGGGTTNNSPQPSGGDSSTATQSTAAGQGNQSTPNAGTEENPNTVDSNNAEEPGKSQDQSAKAKGEKDEKKEGEDNKDETKKDGKSEGEEEKKEGGESEAKAGEEAAADQQKKSDAAEKDSDPEKALQAQAQTTPAPQEQNTAATQAEGSKTHAVAPAQARPNLGRRNPLKQNTPTASNQPRPSTSAQAANTSSKKTEGASQTGSKAPAGTSFANKAQNQMRQMADRQSADEKSGKVESDKMTQGPGIDAKKNGSITTQVADSANVEKKVAEGAARRAGALAGGLGASKGTQQNITVSLITLINIVFLVLEVVSGIGVLLFILHVILFLYWLFTEDRWKHSWMAAAAVFVMPFLSVFGIIAGFCIAIMGTAFIACHQMAESIPFGIPINFVTSIGSMFGANTGPFAQVCDLINVHSAGVGGVSRPHTATPSTTGGATHAVGTINGRVVLVDDNGQTLTPVIDGTQLVHPQPLSSELNAQANQAGYVSPASCKLGEIPYSDQIVTRNVQLDNGQTKLVAFPIHKTIDCIQNDPTNLSVRSVQLGKVVRRVEEDTVLGKYVTVEYPNGLRVSYYHLASIPDSIALGSVVNAGQSVGTMGKTGQISFTGTQMLFELKDADGNWQVFNPVRNNADSSVLTIFPCAGDSSNKCLLQ